MKYLIGNWKSNFTLHQARDWIEKVKAGSPTVPSGLTAIVCPAYHHLSLFASEFPDQTLGVQTVSPFPSGTYTGAICAQMVKDQVKYTIAGHSERRTYFHEDNQSVANQVSESLAEGLTPVIAVDKTNWLAQLNLIGKDPLSKCLVMYEPPEAISRPTGPIGEGTAASLAEVVSVIHQIKAEFTCLGLIYGGSVKSDNLTEFLGHPDIDGVLPGSASLNPDEWLKMIAEASQLVS